MLDLPLAARVEQLRAKELAGTLTLEEMREAIALIRQGRVSASIASAKSRTPVAPVDTGALLASLKAKPQGA